jgi:hypothetical protein
LSSTTRSTASTAALQHEGGAFSSVANGRKGHASRPLCVYRRAFYDCGKEIAYRSRQMHWTLLKARRQTAAWVSPIHLVNANPAAA